MLHLSDKEKPEDMTLEGLYSNKLLNTPSRYSTIRKWMWWVFLFLVLCLFLPWQQNIQGYGKVTPFRPEDRPQQVQSVIGGRIEKWFVREGQLVNRGDTIMIISETKEKFMDPQLLARTDDQIRNKQEAIRSKMDKVGALQKQVSALQAGLHYKLQQTKNKVKQYQFKVEAEKADYEAAKVNYKLADDQYSRLEQLYKKGLASLTELQNRNNKKQEAQSKLISAENKVNSAQNELMNAEIELNTVETDYLDKISKAKSTLDETVGDVYESQAEVSKMRIEYGNLQVRSGLYVVRAPQDGYIVKALRTGIGENIKEGEQVVTIMPSHANLAAELYVKAVDLPLLFQGCKVRLQFDGWPALVFSGWNRVSVGTFGGVVQVIDRVNSDNGLFRVLVTPDPDDEQWPEMIRAGSGVYGWAMLNNVALGYELWRQFNGFPPDLVKEISNTGADKKDKKTEKSKDDE